MSNDEARAVVADALKTAMLASEHCERTIRACADALDAGDLEAAVKLLGVLSSSAGVLQRCADALARALGRAFGSER